MNLAINPRLKIALLAGAVSSVLVTSMSPGVVQAATSFPDYPLQSGAGTVPPNIMFVLDNSGSMAEYNMNAVGASNISPVNFRAHARQMNSLAYDPLATYKPWDVDLAGTATVVAGGTTYNAAFRNINLATDPGTIGGNGASVFYVLRSAAAAGASTSYDRYRIDATGTVMKAAVTGTNVDLDQSYGPVAQNQFVDALISLPANAGAVTIRLTPVGTWTGDADMYVTADGTTPTSANARAAATLSGGCVSEGSTSAEACADIEVVGATTLKVRIFAYTAIQTVRLEVSSARVGTESAGVPGNRTNAAEATNIATWYSFHRTRIKVAKAGASQAFIGLGTGYRVGYDTINTVTQAGSGSSNTTLRSPIPVGVSSGRFEGVNRTSWFTLLHGELSGGGTPLRSALKRSGDYYSTAAPWGDGTGTDEQACRASFALLSTDGYWNSDSGFTIGTGDVDGDSWSNTLADVAKYYWQTDLRPALANLVPTTPRDTANWQHMGLFGVSIGLQGTIPVSATPPTSWPDPTDTEDAERIDDLWHASVNARGSFIVAAQADEYAKALRSALDNIKEQVSSGSNLTANGNSLNSGAQIFQAMFTSRLWSGDIKAYDISLGGIAATADWSMADAANNTQNNFSSRPVLTWFNNQGAAFGTTTVPNATVFARTSTPVVTAANNIAYIKGDRSLETRNGGNLRDRASPIGDIVNSSPFYQRETGMMFIGANDGMLHGVDADDGRVLFSYVPAGINFAALATLSDPSYLHRFFVDGQLDVSTVAQGNGKNILVGALGRGGKGVFALDVTIGQAGTWGNSNVLWDRTAIADADMGYVLGQPVIRKGNNGSTLVMVGNGVESAGGKAVLYIYVLAADGTISSVLKYDTLIAGGNGMSEPRAADVNGDGTVDLIYAGDLKGNLWRVDVSDPSTSQWGFSFKTNGNNGTPLPMFTATDPAGVAQPITGAVALAREPGSLRIFVNFGTGKLLSSSDITTQSSVEQTQTVYSLIDNGARITAKTELQERTIPFVGTDSQGRPARSFEAFSELPTAKRGWYLNLATNAQAYARGERVVTAPLIRGRASWFSSLVPNLGEGCANTGKGFLNAIDVFTGTNPAGGSFMDANGNGRGDDKISSGGSTPGGNNGYLSSIDLGVAMPGQPVQIGDVVAVGGSNAKNASVRKASGNGTPKRLSWREILNRE